MRALIMALLIAMLAACGTSSQVSDGQPAVTESVTEADLPAPVLAAVKSHRRAIFVSGEKVTRGDIVEYHLTLKGSRRTAMIVKPDGEVVSFE